ncbi:hypothetical protein K488DRAFT_91714 [Vararia minispora EC-137]|uniref:Uncharacterized protein n=1 Tax=Vararia minispora EC-137 TaxID=1314806 RepID=A0ACB8Q539_9AGAM|nr:hypothetical protein K488DRAFT_91714 [Vararia minispora EC-137]
MTWPGLQVSIAKHTEATKITDLATWEDEALAQGGVADDGRVLTLFDDEDVEDNALDLEEATLSLGDDFQDLDLQNDDAPASDDEDEAMNVPPPDDEVDAMNEGEAMNEGDAMNVDHTLPVLPPPPPHGRRYIKQFGGCTGESLNPDIVADSTYSLYESALPDAEDTNNAYHPFASKLEWELAEWAKTRGVGATAFTELLQIEGLADKLDLQYRSSRDLNHIVDGALPVRPAFVRRTYQLGGETYELYLRDAMGLVKALYGSPEFANELVFAPEKHYVQLSGEGGRITWSHRFSDMHTGWWWWQLQAKMESERPGVTIIPIIILSDKTQLTLFCNCSAYPMYLTIGNILKETCWKPSPQAQLLLGYLPVSRLTQIKNAESRQCALVNLFHTCMKDILNPFEAAGVDGVIMTSGDGQCRWCHPIFAAFVGDYPEQVLVTGTKYGHCPKGTVDPALLGSNVECELCDHAREAGVKPIDTFWTNLPYADIYKSVMLDILHQLYQGMIKHVIEVIVQLESSARALSATFSVHLVLGFGFGVNARARLQ